MSTLFLLYVKTNIYQELDYFEHVGQLLELHQRTYRAQDYFPTQ